jgi:hypothetical protein
MIVQRRFDLIHSNKHSLRLVMRMGIAAMVLALVAFLAP